MRVAQRRGRQRGTGFYPVCNHLDFGVRELPCVLEVAVAGRGFPRRHETCLRVFSDFGCPRLCVAVVDECEGRDLAVPMACLAILLEDGCDVLAVGDLCGETGFGEMDRASERWRLLHRDRGIGVRCEERVS